MTILGIPSRIRKFSQVFGPRCRWSRCEGPWRKKGPLGGMIRRFFRKYYQWEQQKCGLARDHEPSYRLWAADWILRREMGWDDVTRLEFTVNGAMSFHARESMQAHCVQPGNAFRASTQPSPEFSCFIR
jgi:hypothetical protein